MWKSAVAFAVAFTGESHRFQGRQRAPNALSSGNTERGIGGDLALETVGTRDDLGVDAER